jgi:hypothetical protein
VVEATTVRLDGDVVGRQLDVGVRVPIILLDVGIEVLGVVQRPETGGRHWEGGDG